MADITPVILGAKFEPEKRPRKKPAGMSESEWRELKEAWRVSDREAKRPHPFALAHEMLRQSAEARKRERDAAKGRPRRVK